MWWVTTAYVTCEYYYSSMKGWLNENWIHIINKTVDYVIKVFYICPSVGQKTKLTSFCCKVLDTRALCCLSTPPNHIHGVCRKRDWRNRIFEVTFDCPARPWPSLIVPQSRGIRRKNPSANTTAGTLSQIRQKMWQLTICHISPEEEGKYFLVTKSVCKAACPPCETRSLLMVDR